MSYVDMWMRQYPSETLHIVWCGHQAVSAQTAVSLMTNGPSKDTDISNVFIENKKWRQISPIMDIFRALPYPCSVLAFL